MIFYHAFVRRGRHLAALTSSRSGDCLRSRKPGPGTSQNASSTSSDWDAGFSAGQADVEADLLTLLDEFGLEHLAAERHPISVLRDLLREKRG
jgi:hypothetical protein